ncbi:hypothetical protein KEM56_007780 [Ascosphaera pollenicola]|nr:hypothetical protein KEM56_007780 [Ascosphaera pollenicola]
MSRRTRRGGPVEELVALPSEVSEEEEEEYQSSDEEAYSKSNSSSGSGSDDSDEDVDPDDSLEADVKEPVSSVRKRGIAQKVKKPRAGQPAPKKRVIDRIEDDDNLAETTGSEGRATNGGDVDIEDPGRAEKGADETTGTLEGNDKSKGYKTKKDVPIPVVEGDDEA